jgi:hypothetical protein
LSHINAIRFDGKSIYHAVTLKLERRFASNVAYNVSYTLSHSKDDASSPGATESEANVPQNVRNIFDETGEWALSSFDHRHQFIASGVYELPFFTSRRGVTPRRGPSADHGSSSGGKYSTFSTVPISTCRTARLATRTSAGSSERKPERDAVRAAPGLLETPARVLSTIHSPFARSADGCGEPPRNMRFRFGCGS